MGLNQIADVFTLAGVEECVLSSNAKPSKEDPAWKEWMKKNMFATMLILSNITDYHANRLTNVRSARDMWLELRNAHESQGDSGALILRHKLINMRADESTDIEKYLTEM